MIMKETSWEYVIRENRIEIKPFYNNKEVQKDGSKSFFWISFSLLLPYV